MSKTVEENQIIAKRMLINLLKRKGTVITQIDGSNDLRKGYDDYDLPIVYGVTTNFSIQLSYKKLKPC